MGFEIDGNYALVELEGGWAYDYSVNYQSVIGMGKLSLVEDNKEK